MYYLLFVGTYYLLFVGMYYLLFVGMYYLLFTVSLIFANCAVLHVLLSLSVGQIPENILSDVEYRAADCSGKASVNVKN
jgi:hypothetical protein